jgi:glutamine amidotransferase
VSKPTVVVLDYGTGNIHSALKAVEAAGATAVLSKDKTACAEADGLLVPGVGAFAAVMEALNKVDGGEIIERRLSGGRAVLGICVGMQVMFKNGLEGGVDTPGLGEWDETVHKLDAEILPHMGWNTVEVGENSKLFSGIENERFYFVHSYAVTEWNLDVIPPFPKPSVTWSEHGQRFVAAVENGPLMATQFHPEKSGEAGIHLLRNWISTF